MTTERFHPWCWRRLVSCDVAESSAFKIVRLICTACGYAHTNELQLAAHVIRKHADILTLHRNLDIENPPKLNDPEAKDKELPSSWDVAEPPTKIRKTIVDSTPGS